MSYDDASTAPPSGGHMVAGRRIDWGLREVGFGALWFLTLFLLVPIPLTLPFLPFGDESRPFYAATMIATYVSQLGMVAVASWFTFRKYGGSWERLGFARPTASTFGWGAAAFAGALAVSLSYNLLIRVLGLDWLEGECDDQLPAKILNDPLLLALAGVAVVGLAPVCEEIFFRGFAFPGLARNWGIFLGAFGSALFWSSMHISPAIYKTLLPILGIGIVFALTYVRSRNILSVVAAHLAFNIIGYIAIVGCDP